MIAIFGNRGSSGKRGHQVSTLVGSYLVGADTRMRLVVYGYSRGYRNNGTIFPPSVAHHNRSLIYNVTMTRWGGRSANFARGKPVLNPTLTEDTRLPAGRHQQL